MRTLSIAALQISPVSLDVEATWVDLRRRVSSVCGTWRHVQMLVVPELHLCALGEPGETPGNWMERTAESIPGPSSDRLAALAAHHKVWIVGGSIYERAEGGSIYNTTPVLDPQGHLAATYRKIFPWQPYETNHHGTSFTVFDVPGVGRVGLAICYDGTFPETYRQLAWMGAEVVIQPTLTTTGDREMETLLARANASFNQVYSVNLNAAGPLATGRSLIVDPEGLVRQEAGEGPQVLIDVLDLDAVTRVRRYGTLGLNRMWDQVARTGSSIDLPAYGGKMLAPPWLEPPPN